MLRGFGWVALFRVLRSLRLSNFCIEGSGSSVVVELYCFVRQGALGCGFRVTVRKLVFPFASRGYMQGPRTPDPNTRIFAGFYQIFGMPLLSFVRKASLAMEPEVVGPFVPKLCLDCATVRFWKPRT